LKRLTFSINDIERLLENQRNRSVNQIRVGILAEQMRLGQWRPEVAPILLYQDGTLADGQHRLHAALKVGKPLECWVAVIDRQDITKVDAGLPRNTYNHCQILGIELSKSDIAAAKVCIVLARGSFNLKQAFAHDVVLEACEIYPVRKYRAPGMSVFAGACAFLDTVSPGVEEFHRQVTVGELLTSTDPAYHLRNALLMPLQGNMMREEILVKIVRAWNCYARGERMGVLKPGKRPFEWMDIERKEAKDGAPLLR
jgi:hypothetical protein